MPVSGHGSGPHLDGSGSDLTAARAFCPTIRVACSMSHRIVSTVEWNDAPLGEPLGHVLSRRARQRHRILPQMRLVTRRLTLSQSKQTQNAPPTVAARLYRRMMVLSCTWHKHDSTKGNAPAGRFHIETAQILKAPSALHSIQIPTNRPTIRAFIRSLRKWTGRDMTEMIKEHACLQGRPQEPYLGFVHHRWR